MVLFYSEINALIKFFQTQIIQLKSIKEKKIIFTIFRFGFFVNKKKNKKG
jgi:hypothetical protein